MFIYFFSQSYTTVVINGNVYTVNLSKEFNVK